MTKNQKRIERERIENRERSRRADRRASKRAIKWAERTTTAAARHARPMLYDRAKYGPAIDIKPTFREVVPSGPKPRRYFGGRIGRQLARLQKRQMGRPR